MAGIKPTDRWWVALDPDNLDDLHANGGLTTEQWQQAALERAQQVGEDVATQIARYRAEQQPCPACQRPMGDHSPRQLRRCDNRRPDLQIVS